MTTWNKLRKLVRNFIKPSAEVVPSPPPQTGHTPSGQDTPVDRTAPTSEQLFSPFTLNDLISLCELLEITITAEHETFIHAILDDLAVAITVSEDHTWLLFKAEFPVPPPGHSTVSEEPHEPSVEEIDRQLHLLIDATNEWNSGTLYPTAYVDRKDDQWLIRLDTAFFIAAGLTISQFENCVEIARNYTQGAIRQLPALIPPG
ncbi:MAG: YbjN domain-containing protein [Actinomycetaceae bacterium]|nr:YbjN domain-containing protein [Actinomycetaceae bacterium]